MKKRNNSFVSTPMDVILVGSGNQNLKLADNLLTGGGNAVNIANGQLGVVNLDEYDQGGFGLWDFLDGGGDVHSEVKKIKIIQGTANSTQLTNVNPFGVNAPAFYQSGVLRWGKVNRLVTTKPALREYDIQCLTGFTAPTEAVVYTLTTTVQSHKRDIAYTPQKRDQVVVTGVVPVGTTNDLEYLLDTLGGKANLQSLFTIGTKPFVIFGVDYDGGGGGTTIGGMANGDSVNFQTYGGITYAVTMTTSMIKSFYDAVQIDANLSTATIEVLNLDSPGANGNIDCLLVMSYEEPDAFAFDDSKTKCSRVTASIDLTLTCQLHYNFATEGEGYGSVWKLKWHDRNAAFIHALHRVGHDYDITNEKLPCAIDEDTFYTSTIIEFWGEENLLTQDEYSPHTVTILLAAAISDDTLDVDNGPYVWATTQTNTVTDLNNVFENFFTDNASDIGGVDFEGEATPAAPFV